MALRIKSRWHDSGRNEATEKTLSDHAGALAFILWRLALDKAKTLHGEDYVYTSDGQRIAIICEYLAFGVQVVDRLAYLREMPEDEREFFVNAFASRATDHVEDNAVDLFGPGDYRTGFTKTLNKRLQEYSEYSFTKAGPGYSFLRLLGVKCQAIMNKGDAPHMNRWVIDQVMEKDAPDVVQKLESSVDDLLG
ncbi:MAG: hypothetical protein KDH88_14630 [Chromatiales bacterium]|nr:hypothetical protein [Chromatiales bacterium]